MAGPLSSEEIEDVVSSVRRLVSNEQSSRRLSRDLGGEKLLLTPALRVVSETSPLAPLILDTQVDDPAVETDKEILTDSLAAALDDDAVDLIEAEWEDELWSGSDVVSLGEVALIAEEAEVLPPPHEESEDVVADADARPEPEADVGRDRVKSEPIPFVPLRRPTEEVTDQPVAVASPDTDVDPTAGPDNVVQPGQPEDEEAQIEMVPSEDADDPLFDRTNPANEAEPQLAPPNPPVHSTATEIVDADGTPLAVLDEAALQEIVRQMIREELQGDLGERITRNVRKLVRAEINRALMARDLD